MINKQQIRTVQHESHKDNFDTLSRGNVLQACFIYIFFGCTHTKTYKSKYFYNII